MFSESVVSIRHHPNITQLALQIKARIDVVRVPGSVGQMNHHHHTSNLSATYHW